MAVALTAQMRDSAQTLEQAIRRAKFSVASPPRRLLQRRHLLDRVHALTEREAPGAPVTLVSAPVGTGKTVLLAALVRERPVGTSAWCTLDRADNDPYEFGLSVLEAILTTQSPEGVGRAARGKSATDALDEALLLAGCGDHLVLVLDECEHLRVDAMQSTIRRLIRQAPPNLSIVLVTNQDLQLGGRTTEIATLRGADLAFTRDELVELFAHERLPIAEDTADILTRWTVGHASAVMLAAAAYHDARDRDAMVASALRDDGSAHVVLCERVLDRLSSDEHDVLLASAVVDPVSADLVDVISDVPDAGEVLGSLVRTDVFFDAIPGCRGWYRHRHPSRELLVAELDLERGGDVEDLHARAAHWFAERGHRRRALDSALAAKDWNLIAELVRDQWSAATLAELDPALGDVPAVPDDVAARGIDSMLLAIAIDVERGERERATERLATLSESQLRAGNSPESQLFEALLRLRVARDDADAAAIRHVARTLTELSHASAVGLARVDDIEALVRRATAEANLLDGDLDAAMQLLERVCDEAVVNGDAMQAADATAALAVATALSGRVRRASALVDELGDSWFSGMHFSRGVRATARAICEYHADDVIAAQSAASEARGALRPGVYRDTALSMVQARLAMSIGDAAGGARQMRRAEGNGREALFGVVADALGLAEPASSHPYAVARMSLASAQRAYDEDRFDEAWSALEHALALVERNSYNRIVTDSGLHVRPMLHEYIAQARPFSQVAWQLLQRLPTERPADAAPLVETLTDRELAVLRHLPTMKSNREIAAEMYFSVNTVKTHLKSIYRKLGVNRRRAAVEEARARSLL